MVHLLEKHESALKKSFLYSWSYYSSTGQSLCRITCFNFLVFHPFGWDSRAVLAVWFSGPGSLAAAPDHWVAVIAMLFPFYWEAGRVVLLLITNGICSKGTIISFILKPSLSLIQIGRGWKESFLPRAPSQHAKRQDSTVAEHEDVGVSWALIWSPAPIHCVTLGNVLNSSVPQFSYLKQRLS